ncbi:hypothetical protein [Microbacterium sp.]|uniref:hypothetical protein n=1 Tax=Microbacterium sp. TaxID=51671 RepID=UPI0039E26D59
MKSKLILPSAALEASVALASCASTGEITPAASSSPSPAKTAQAEPGLFFGSADFEPALSTHALADTAALVARGRLKSASEGPVAGKAGDEFSDIGLLVLELEVKEAVKGALPPSSDGNLYLRIPFPAGPDHFLEIIPPGSDVVVYANEIDASAEGDGQLEVIDPERGAPQGQPVFVLSHPQGLVFDVSSDRSGDLFWPFAGYRAKASIAEALPGGSEVGFSPETAPPSG